ncbi:MAG: S8 family serine peptidase [Sphingobacteriaceae bacterium]|nr:S8 family serine peptidase [Sphingobacteriaceae bacterium]
MKYFHRILNNPKGLSNHFDAARGFDTEDDDEKEETVKDYQYQKQVLSAAIERFETGVRLKYERRSIAVPYDIYYIRVDFLVTFDDFNEFKTRELFRKKYGLRDIHYFNFNRSVLFEVEDRDKCNKLLILIEQYTQSPPDIDPGNQPYAIATIIYGFDLLTREQLLAGTEGLEDHNNSVAIQLTTQEDTEKEDEKGQILGLMMDYLNASKSATARTELTGERFLTVSGLSRADLVTLVDNFDIIASVQAIRFSKVKPLSGGNTMRSFDFQINPVAENLPLVAVIDNGVNRIQPLSTSIADFGYTFDMVYQPYSTQVWHGTAVAVITATGDRFFSGAPSLDGDCRIVSYRIFEREEGHIDFIDFERVIRECYAKGVRLFNLSSNISFKPYNSDYSFFSYLLDKLSYELDILFFISAGNLNADDLENIYQTMATGVYHSALEYPKHFFYPDADCMEHSCDGTNLKIPAESLNNLTIGAIADNLEEGTQTDMTLDKYLPAYYTSKYHVSPFHKVNGTRLKSKHINYKLFKPDITYPGGDYGQPSSGIQLTGSGVGNDHFRQECGTSFAAPFAANLAAKIFRLYPNLSTQSVKALIINSAKPLTDSRFLAEHLEEMKEKFSQEEFGKGYTELNKSEKLKVNKWFHREDIFDRLVGHGKPDTSIALSSGKKSITIIVEDQIRTDTHKAIPIHLPAYLRHAIKSKTTTIVSMSATLCFKFQPNFKDQTGYNPLHISFNFLKTFGNPDNTAQLAAYRDDGSDFYRDLYRGITEAKDKTAKRNEALGVKTTISSWSDDFFPNGRQFSNCQKLEMPINLQDLHKTGNELSLVVRCIGKKETTFDTKSYLQGSHPFSLVITLREKGGKEIEAYDYYEEFIKINQTLDAVAQGELDTDLEAEA